MMDLAAEKAAARTAAAGRRAVLHRNGAGAARRAAGHALQMLSSLRGARVVSAYLPMRSELDPLPLMRSLVGLGYVVAVPNVEDAGLPLAFRRWSPGAKAEKGPHGAPLLRDAEPVTPEVVLAPLLAFDDEGWRLGYGGGYYDRTIAALRAAGPIVALGLGYAGQRVARTPRGALDARLDGIVTEEGLVRPEVAGPFSPV